MPPKSLQNDIFCFESKLRIAVAVDTTDFRIFSPEFSWLNKYRARISPWWHFLYVLWAETLESPKWRFLILMETGKKEFWSLLNLPKMTFFWIELRKSPQNNIFSDQVKISTKRQLFFWSIFSKKNNNIAYRVLPLPPTCGFGLEFQPAVLSAGLEKSAGWWGGSTLY